MARKPKYKHNCSKCIFLGTYEKVFDLYYCKQGTEAHTVISRFGDLRDDYFSGMKFATKDGLPSLYEAKKRAIRLKLYNND